MKFWAYRLSISRRCIFDFAKEDDTMDLTETCFLPTEELAKSIIGELLNSYDYIPVEIELETLQKNGIWSYTRGKVERWDEE